MPQAWAQSTFRASSADDVAMIFYKTGNSVPNFTKWVERTEEFNHTPWALREKKLQSEKLKLLKEYQEIDLTKDLIHVKIPIEISLEKQMHEEKEFHILALKFKGAENIDYFPYSFSGQHIAVIPTNLKDFRKTIISEEKYNSLSALLEKTDKASFNSLLELQAYEADLTQPHDLDGIYQWILKTKIAIFTIADSRNNIVWEKMESWYISPTTHTLNDLYQGQYEEELEYINTQQ
ncbi:MAG: hypothetical protein HRT94_04740 [Alphaproteobacteria bacterium]|nr:hypothetical protein [Alphaproteobacteria bacterium]